MNARILTWLTLVATSVGCVYAGPACVGSTCDAAGTDSGTGARGDAAVSVVADDAQIQSEWYAVTSNLGTLRSECGNMSFLAAKPDEDMLIAGIAANGLWGSTDGGGSWAPMGRGTGSDVIDNRTSSIVFDPLDPKRFWQSGIYGSAAYVTEDGGDTFRALSKEERHADAIAVDLEDPQRRTALLSGHEQPQKLRLSRDGGVTWTEIGAALPAGITCNNPRILDADTFLVGCSYSGTGLYRSDDGGATFTLVHPSAGTGLGTWLADGSLAWLTSEGGMVRSTDRGLSWVEATPPNTLAFGFMVALPDGRLAALTRKAVVVSSDQGANWRVVSSPLPFDPTGFTYSVHQKAFFVWRFSCDNGLVPADAIMRFDFDG